MKPICSVYLKMRMYLFFCIIYNYGWGTSNRKMFFRKALEDKVIKRLGDAYHNKGFFFGRLER